MDVRRLWEGRLVGVVVLLVDDDEEIGTNLPVQYRQMKGTRSPDSVLRGQRYTDADTGIPHLLVLKYYDNEPSTQSILYRSTGDGEEIPIAYRELEMHVNGGLARKYNSEVLHSADIISYNLQTLFIAIITNHRLPLYLLIGTYQFDSSSNNEQSNHNGPKKHGTEEVL